jgi:hypothetical protein
LSARYQATSTPLSAGEQVYASWLQAEFFRGGLQMLQLHNPFDEEKDESRTSTSCTTTPGLFETCLKYNESSKMKVFVLQ